MKKQFLKLEGKTSKKALKCFLIMVSNFWLCSGLLSGLCDVHIFNAARSPGLSHSSVMPSLFLLWKTCLNTSLWPEPSHNTRTRAHTRTHTPGSASQRQTMCEFMGELLCVGPPHSPALHNRSVKPDWGQLPVWAETSAIKKRKEKKLYNCMKRLNA